MECVKFNIDLTWLNSLGGWEHWRFTAFKTYGYDIDNVEIIEKDILQNWDANFIAGGTQQDVLSQQARETITVRSQNLSIQQINAIARIKFSIRVIDETDSSNLTTVITDKSSFQYRTDNDKRHSIEFDILYPNQQTQSQ